MLEYGLTDLCIGVPVIIGKNGIEKIVEINQMMKKKKNLSNQLYVVQQIIC